MIDNKKNILTTNNAEYDDNLKVFKTYGLTRVSTTNNYKIEGSDIVLKKNDNFIFQIKKLKFQIAMVTIFSRKILNIKNKIIYLNQLA